jgi:hypothetical protein
MLKLYATFFLLNLLILLYGCSPSSVEDFRKEGQYLNRKLIKELNHIQSRQELNQALPELKALFNELVELAIEAREFQEEHPNNELMELNSYDEQINRKLREELSRIYLIEEGRQIVEQAQEQALYRLDAFEKKMSKKMNAF